MIDLKKLQTEGNNQLSKDIDSLPTFDILSIINFEDQTVAFSVKEALHQIEQLVDNLAIAMKNGGRLIYCGAGTSGRIGLLDSVECPPTYGVDPSSVICLMAGGDSAFAYAKEGAEDDEEQAIKDLLSINPTPHDFLIGIAASGRTPYVLSMLKKAKALGMKTGCIVNTKSSPISQIVDFPIEVVTNAEVISGSTRMKAGTAQKLVCNMISTAVMIKLGHVYQNYMIDLKATNQKLITRQLSIISAICEITLDEAKELLDKHQTVKKAILAFMLKIEDNDLLDELLNKNENNLRKAIENND